MFMSFHFRLSGAVLAVLLRGDDLASFASAVALINPTHHSDWTHIAVPLCVIPDEDCQTHHQPSNSIWVRGPCNPKLPHDPYDQQKDFAFRCRFVSVHIQNLLSLTLHIRLKEEHLLYLLENPSKITSIRAVNRVPLRSAFIFNLEV